MSTRAKWLLGCLALAAHCSTAQAQLSSRGVMDDALLRLRTAAQGWEGAMLGAAGHLFWALATISLVWTMGQLVMRRAELGEVFGELVRFVMLTGFWAWMLAHGAEHARLIMESFQVLGGEASARSVLSPSSIVDVGFHLLERMLTQSSILSSPIDTAVGLVLAFVILVILALIAINMLVLFASVWFVAYGGLIVLGFGGCRWTSDMAVNYYRKVLSLGLEVLAMSLIVAMGQAMIEHYAKALGPTDIKIQDQAVLLVVAIMLLALVNKVPPLVASLANGAGGGAMGPGFGAGEALTAASTALAGAALAKTALSAAGSAIASGIMGADSAGSALAGNAMDPAVLWGEGHEGRIASRSDGSPADEQDHDHPSSSSLTDEQDHDDQTSDDSARHEQRGARGLEAEQRTGGSGKTEQSSSSTDARKSPERFTGDRPGSKSPTDRGKASLAAAAIEHDRLRAEFDSSRPQDASPRTQASKPSGQTRAADRSASRQTDSVDARYASNALPHSPAASGRSAMAPASAASHATAVADARHASGSPMTLSATQHSVVLPAQPPPTAGALAVAPSVWSLGSASAPVPSKPPSWASADGALAVPQSAVRDFGGVIAGLADNLVAHSPSGASTPQTPPPVQASTLPEAADDFSVDLEAEVAAFRDRG